MIFLNAIVLIFEILYYSLFMYYSKNEGKLSKYVLLFSLITAILFFTENSSLYSYLFFIVSTFLGMKYIVNCKVKFFDLFIIFSMLLFNFLLQLFPFIFIKLFTKDIIIKTLFLILIKGIFIFKSNILRSIFNNMKVKWDKNFFFIRYTFVVIMFLLIISSAIYIIGS